MAPLAQGALLRGALTNALCQEYCVTCRTVHCCFASLPQPIPSPDGSGSVRWVVSDVVGTEDGLGVECLSGSAAIGSAFCRWAGGHVY